jgi:hypothetical protein
LLIGQHGQEERKNWQFFGSEEGADAAAVLMSLGRSSREHGVNPLLYLRD